MKNKTIAVLLAIFFSYFAYLYTYKKNAKKFWILLSINLFITLYLLIQGFNYPSLAGFLAVSSVITFLNALIWLGVLIDTATLPEQYFK